MTDLLKGRQFQLWEYRVSHGSLLIRSPASPSITGKSAQFSVDILCHGVEYISAPRHLGEISISRATDMEIEMVTKMLRKKVQPSSVWALQNSDNRFLLVAADVIVREHRGDIFESPFDFNPPR
jgi:hypothetical protein